MNDFSDKIKEYLIPVFSIIVVIALIPLVIMPQLNNITSSNKVINDNKDRLTSLTKKASELDKLSQNKDDLQKKLEIAESAMPITKDVAHLILGVQQVAIGAGLQVTDLKIQPGKTATASATIKSTPANQTTTQPTAPVTTSSTTSSTADNLVFEMNLNGNLASFQTFMKSLETAKRILSLNQFKASPNSSDRSGNTFAFDVFINAPFSQLPTIASDQISQELPTLTSADQKLLDYLDSNSVVPVTQTPIPEVPTGVTDPFKQ